MKSGAGWKDHGHHNNAIENRSACAGPFRRTCSHHLTRQTQSSCRRASHAYPAPLRCQQRDAPHEHHLPEHLRNAVQNAILQNAVQNAIAALFDVGARATSQHLVPGHIDKCLALDLVGRKKSLKSERVASKAAADAEADNKSTLGRNIRDGKQKLMLTAKLAKIQKRR
jgi:hypothetical protein